MSVLSRREWLARSSGIVVASIAAGAGVNALAQGLGTFGTASGPPPCSTDTKPTPSAPVGPDFKPNSPARTSLVEPGMAGTRLVLTGTVSGVRCGLIKHAKLDFWQADAHGVYARDTFTLRGHQFSDDAGAFRLETIVPGASGTRAPSLHVTVTPPGKTPFTTQLFFPGASENKSDPAFRSEQLIAMTDGRGGKTGAFNLILDL
jgi:protocatechuate 3,4-dioxygenase beta subunit